MGSRRRARPAGGRLRFGFIPTAWDDETGGGPSAPSAVEFARTKPARESP
jgi:hypothetical protein